jgi:hypothetical protein
MLPSEDECIAQWGQMSRSALAELEPDDGFEKRHLLNPAVLRILGDVAGQRASGSLAQDPSPGAPGESSSDRKAARYSSASRSCST